MSTTYVRNNPHFPIDAPAEAAYSPSVEHKETQESKRTTKVLRGTITITRRSNDRGETYISIRVEDKNSGSSAIEIDIAPEAFAMALTGLGDQECTFTPASQRQTKDSSGASVTPRFFGERLRINNCWKWVGNAPSRHGGITARCSWQCLMQPKRWDGQTMTDYMYWAMMREIIKLHHIHLAEHVHAITCKQTNQ